MALVFNTLIFAVLTLLTQIGGVVFLISLGAARLLKLSRRSVRLLLLLGLYGLATAAWSGDGRYSRYGYPVRARGLAVFWWWRKPEGPASLLRAESKLCDNSHATGGGDACRSYGGFLSGYGYSGA